jgi:hypothetical protein
VIHSRGLKAILQKVKTPLGECEGSCGRNTVYRCAPNLKCARANQVTLETAGYHPQYAYCATTGRKVDNYVCYDPIKAQKPACNKTYADYGEKCSPTDPQWISDDICLVTGLDDTYCCRATLSEYNETHAHCAIYPTCSGYKSCSCMDVGTDVLDYEVTCSSYTECYGAQCV